MEFLFSSAIPEMFVNSDTLLFFFHRFCFFCCTTATHLPHPIEHVKKESKEAKRTKMNTKPCKNVHW